MGGSEDRKRKKRQARRRLLGEVDETLPGVAKYIKTGKIDLMLMPDEVLDRLVGPCSCERREVNGFTRRVHNTECKRHSEQVTA